MAGRIPSVPSSVPPFVLGKLRTNCGAAPRVAWGHLSGKTSVMMLAVRHAAPARERWGQPSEPHNFMRSKPLSASGQEVLRYCATPLCCNEPFFVMFSWLDHARALSALSSATAVGHRRTRGICAQAARLTAHSSCSAAWALGTGRSGVCAVRRDEGAQRAAQCVVRSFFFVRLDTAHSSDFA